MLKLAVFFGGMVFILTGCSLLPTQRDPGEPLPPNWDASQDQGPAHFPGSIPASPKSLSPLPGETNVVQGGDNTAVVTAIAPASQVVAETTPAAVTNSGAGHFEETWVPLSRWAKTCGFEPAKRVSLPSLEVTVTNAYLWQDVSLEARMSLVPLPTFLLHTTNGVLMLQSDSRTAYWDDVEIHLGFPPALVQGEVLVHTLDLRETIEPLLHNRPLLRATNRAIVIDPDYDDGSDSVPIDLRGQNFALDWAKRLAPLLVTNGWTVFLTHTNALMVPLDRRGAFSDIRHPDLFLHLCFGIRETGQTHSGLAAYCLPPVNMPSDDSQPGFEETWQVFPNNAFDDENWEYAFCLHRALTQVPGTEDQGLRRCRRLEILRNRDCPAVCVSGGSLLDPQDAALIASPLYRQKLAEAIASALH